MSKCVKKNWEVEGGGAKAFLMHVTTQGCVQLYIAEGAKQGNVWGLDPSLVAFVQLRYKCVHRCSI